MPSRRHRDPRKPTSAPLSDKEMARLYSALAIETLAEIALAGDKDSARVAAANALLARAYGAPKRAAKSSDNEDDAEESVSDSWDKLLSN